MGKAMKTFDVRIDVKAVYSVSIEAKDADEAETLGEEMQSAAVQEKGELVDVETSVVEVTEEGGEKEDDIVKLRATCIAFKDELRNVLRCIDRDDIISNREEKAIRVLLTHNTIKRIRIAVSIPDAAP